MAETPLFSICVIARNEAKTFPRRLVPSIQEFLTRGGDAVLIDTGSSDSTPDLARRAGFRVEEVGEKFLISMSPELVQSINDRFVVGIEGGIVTPTSRIFDFASARNHAANAARNEFVMIVDCDEAFEVLNIDAMNALIREGHSRIDVHYTHAYDQYGRPTVEFRRGIFYDRRKSKWECVVHEVITGIDGTPVPIHYPSKDLLALGHHQEATGNRNSYLAGLAYDCYHNQDKDRQSHYFARELLNSGRYFSAIREFERHVKMPNAWHEEKGQSMIYIGDCYQFLKQEQAALQSWHMAFLMDGTRREPLMRLAQFFYKLGDHRKTAAYANAALVLPNAGFYFNVMENYRAKPHELLYVSLWWLGDKEGSRAHWKKALEYEPENPKYVEDAKYYG